MNLMANILIHLHKEKGICLAPSPRQLPRARPCRLHKRRKLRWWRWQCWLHRWWSTQWAASPGPARTWRWKMHVSLAQHCPDACNPRRRCHMYAPDQQTLVLMTLLQQGIAMDQSWEEDENCTDSWAGISTTINARHKVQDVLHAYTHGWAPL